MHKNFTGHLFVFALFLFFSANAIGQDHKLYMPLNIQKAFKTGSRSMDGAPGKEYWQNHSQYKMSVHVYPHSRLLVGQARIIYFNESPDSLKQLVLRTYPDLYKKGNMRDFPIDPSVVNDGMHIHSLAVNGQKIDLHEAHSKARRMGTNLFVQLSNPLAPNDNVRVEITWDYTIPNKSQIRVGAYDKSSFFIGYWYPQMAVYDDVDGWDRINYTGQQEFYNDFSDYDVEIHTPAGFNVWGTGILQNPDEIYPEPQLKMFNEAHHSDKIFRIISKESYTKDSVVINPNAKSWHLIAKHVPDFAFAMSDHYLWDATSVDVGDNGRRVFVSAAYKPESKGFYEVDSIAALSIGYLSKTFPAVPFPFPKLTSFNGGDGGMEFPMIINDTNTDKWSRAVGLTSHEITHSYFPFYMGINERKYAWMDEGWATMLPFDLQLHFAPEYDQPMVRAKRFVYFSGKEMELPPMTPSVMEHGPSYRTASYGRPAMAYEFLRDMLGDKLFLKAMHGYMERWHGHHPLPYDFFNSINDISGKDLNWYFNAWFFEAGYPDLALMDVKNKKGSINVRIKKIGRLPVPVNITLFFDDDSTQENYKSAAVWADGTDMLSMDIPINKKVIKVVLGNSHIPDVAEDNNTFKIK